MVPMTGNGISPSPPGDPTSPKGTTSPDGIAPTHGTTTAGGTGSLVKGGVAGLAGAVVNAGSQFLVVVAVTRGFDAGRAGVLFTATTLCLMVAGILRLDSGNALIYFIARSRRHDCGDISRYFRAALPPVLVLSVAVAAVAIVCGEPIAATLMPGPATALPAPALRTLAVALPIIVCADILVAATRGFGSMRPTALLSGVLQPGAQLVLVGSLALTGTGAGLGWALPAAWAAPALPVMVLSAVWLRRRVPSGPYVPGTGHEFWRYAAPRALGGAVQAVFQRLDIVIVAMLAGPEQAALYTAATRFKVVGQLVNQGLAQAAQPRLVRALADGDLSRAGRLYQTTTMWLVMLTWPLWVGYAVLAPSLLRVFGDGYRDGATVAAVLAVTMMLATACGMVDVVLIAAGHTTSSMMNILGAIMVTVALDIVLIPSHGALGAALGWSGGMLVKNLLPLLQIARLYDLRPFGAHSLPSLRPWHAEEAA
jgi:O-antigen/teichoic acid export membrane protein